MVQNYKKMVPNITVFSFLEIWLVSFHDTKDWNRTKNYLSLLLWVKKAMPSIFFKIRKSKKKLYHGQKKKEYSLRKISFINVKLRFFLLWFFFRANTSSFFQVTVNGSVSNVPIISNLAFIWWCVDLRLTIIQ